MDTSYRKASLEDEEQVRSLLSNVKGDASSFDLNRFVVARKGKKVVGCVRTKKLAGDCLELASLAVLSKYRKKGIGGNLIKKILEKEEKRPIYLITSSEMVSFYKRFGFKVIDSDLLPRGIKEEYHRIISMPFTKDIKVVVMKIGSPRK